MGGQNKRLSLINGTTAGNTNSLDLLVFLANPLINYPEKAKDIRGLDIFLSSPGKDLPIKGGFISAVSDNYRFPYVLPDTEYEIVVRPIFIDQDATSTEASSHRVYVQTNHC